MGLENIVVDHGDILPTTDIARFYLLDVAEFPEDLVGFIMQGEYPHAVVVEPGIGKFGIDTGFDDGDDFFC